MDEINDIEAMKLISAENDESQLKILVSTQCIKAQEHLLNKLTKQAKREQERCSFIRNVNLNTEAEITRLRQGIASLLSHQNTIKENNNELKKELLLIEERKQQQIVKMKNAEKKYDELWLASKAQFESLHFVQKLMKAKERLQDIEQQINELENEEKNIREEMKIKIKNCRELDRKSIIEFAEFMVVERPKYIKLIQEKSVAIKEIADKLKALEHKTNNTMTKPGENGQKADNACASLLPKLKLNYLDLDNLNANADKIKSNDPFTRTPEKIYSVHPVTVIEPNKVKEKAISNIHEYISSFFYKPAAKYEGKKTQNYANMKLINILNDIKIDNTEAKRMVENVDPVFLQQVKSISINNRRVENNKTILNTRDNDNVEDENVEMLDLTSGSDRMILPPTQFLDATTESQLNDSPKVSQKHQIPEEIVEADEASTSKNTGATEEPPKKKVKFDLPNNEEAMEINDINKPENEGEIDANLTINSQADVNDDEFAKIKDMTLKQHNLDSSPQFVYGKNTITPSGLQKLVESVTSKFFPQEPEKINTENNSQVVENIAIEDQAAADVGAIPNKGEDDPVVQGILRKDTVFSTKSQKVPVPTQLEKPFRDFLSRQNIQMTSDYMDESANASVFADTDEIAPCLDSSLLLSPKADLTLPSVNSQDTLSQDMPNFFGGMLKPGLSLFGSLPSEPKTDSTQNQKAGPSGFSFNFGGEKKTSRGGLFSMFQ